MSSFYEEQATRDAEMGISVEDREALEELYLKDPRRDTLAGWTTFFEIVAKHFEAGVSFAPWASHELIHWPLSGKQVPETSEDGKTLIGLGYHLDFEGDEDGFWADHV